MAGRGRASVWSNAWSARSRSIAPSARPPVRAKASAWRWAAGRAASNAAAAVCRLNSDGTLQISLGSVDLTGDNTTFAIIAAEAFGLDDPTQVRVTTVDTDGAPYAGVSGGSKVTYTIGPPCCGRRRTRATRC